VHIFFLTPFFQTPSLWFLLPWATGKVIVLYDVFAEFVLIRREGKLYYCG
jgi:hypothetical protein